MEDRVAGIAIWDDEGRRDLVKYLSDLKSILYDSSPEKGKSPEKALDPILALELQIEGIYDHHKANNNFAQWQNLDFGPEGFLGKFFDKLKWLAVHAPCRMNRNICALDENVRRWSVDETCRALDFSYKIGAKGLVLHAGRVDYWGDFNKETRDKMEASFYKSFKEISEHYITRRYAGNNVEGKGLDLLIENLEVPNLISTRTEHERAYITCAQILSDVIDKKRGPHEVQNGVRMLVDFSHYWNVHITLKNNKDKSFVPGYDEIVNTNIIDYIKNVFYNNSQKIDACHMGGCYNTNPRVTHGVISPIARHYEFNELNLNDILSVPQILEKPIILEVFNVDPKMLIFSHQNVMNFMKSK